MTRKDIASVTLVLALIGTVILMAQDKPAPAATGETRHIGLAKNEEWEVRDGGAGKQFTIDTAGFSEGRFTVMVSTHAKTFGKNPHLEIYPSHLFSDSSSYTQLSSTSQMIAGRKVAIEKLDSKIRGNKTLFSISMSGIEGDKISVTADVYLIR